MSRSEKVQFLVAYSDLGFNLEKGIKDDSSQLEKYSDVQIDSFYRRTKESRQRGFSSVLFY